MAKKKKKHSPVQTGKSMQGAAPISGKKQMKPLSRNLLISSVVLIALAEVLLRTGLVGEMANGAMYILALLLAVGALCTEFGLFATRKI